MTNTPDLDVFRDYTNAWQALTHEWATETFGVEVVADQKERACRFLEEALELVQAVGVSREDVNLLADYTFGRPVGDVTDEVGGAHITLNVLAHTLGVKLGAAATAALAKGYARQEVIRAKNLTKPRGSPLPGTSKY